MMLGLLRGFNAKEIIYIKYCMIIPAAILFFYLAPNMDVSYTRATLQTAAGTADHYSLAANLVFPLLMSIDELRKRNNKALKIVNGVCCFLIISGILMIASRGAIAAAVISIIVYFSLEWKEAGKHIKIATLLRGVVVAAAVIFLGHYLIQHIDLPALTRLQFSAISSDKGTGRLDIWRGFIDAATDNIFRMLFGYGYGTEADISYQFINQKVDAHNVYLEHLATVGLIGLTILLKMIWIPLKRAIKAKDYLSRG